MKRVLITGANGQNGRLLSYIYLKNNFKVFGFVKKKKNGIKGVKYIVNNLLNKNKIKLQLKNIRPNIVIHLASANNSYSQRIKKDNYKINYLYNLKITKKLVNSLNENKTKTRFIFAGSSIMYGNTKKKIVSEKDNFFSNEYYGKYKIDAHNFILNNSNNNLDATTVILFNHDSVYRSKNFLIPKLIKAFKIKNESFLKKIYNENISGDFSHASDICNGIYKISKKNKNIKKIILSSGRRFYINKLIHFLEKRFKFKIEKKGSSNPQRNFKFIGSNKYAKKLINYKCKKDPIDVSKEILKYYQ